jgi:MFS family permease
MTDQLDRKQIYRLPRRYLICALMFLLITINYLDRSVLPVAAKSVAAEFHFSPVTMGYLFSSFVWTYALFTFVTGFIIDRVSTKRIQLVGGSIWSTATFLMAFIWSFPSLLVLRLIMGAAEATSLPTCNKIVREWMPAQERGIATACFSAGTYSGPAFGALMVGAVASAFGWRASFMVAGALGLLWLIPFGIWFDRPERVSWLSSAERDQIVAERAGRMADFDRETPPASLFELLRKRTLWGLAITQFCAIYANNVFLFWLPSYLQSTRGLTILKTGLFTAVPYALAVPLSIAVGLLSDRIIRHRGVAGGPRRNVVATGMLCSAVILAAPLVGNIWLLLALTTISLTGIGTVLALNLALLSDLLPNPRNLGKAVGTVFLVGQMAGISAPILTGYIIAWTGGYQWVFVAGSVLALAGAATCMTMTRKPLVLGVDAAPTPPGDAGRMK